MHHQEAAGPTDPSACDEQGPGSLAEADVQALDWLQPRHHYWTGGGKGATSSKGNSALWVFSMTLMQIRGSIVCFLSRKGHGYAVRGELTDPGRCSFGPSFGCAGNSGLWEIHFWRKVLCASQEMTARKSRLVARELQYRAGPAPAPEIIGWRSLPPTALCFLPFLPEGRFFSCTRVIMVLLAADSSDLPPKSG